MSAFRLLLLLVALFGTNTQELDSSRTPGRSGLRLRSRCSFPSLAHNVIFKAQGKGRVIRFSCPPGSLLIGKRFATCISGKWSNDPPFCISKGCPMLDMARNSMRTELYDGAMLSFVCNPGYIQIGASMVYCDGMGWNGTAPTCTVSSLNPEVTCDFEGNDLCGWSHDVNHDFEWKQNTFGTPSGHVGTGPSFDHTLGYGLAGHYMYLEASSPRKEGDVARMFSPVYPTVLSSSCFIFWYHMLGESTGSLRVYIKGEDQVLSELSPSWSKDGEQGFQWLQGQIAVPLLTTNFQIVIEGVRGTDYIGDSAFDDVTLQPGPCPVSTNQTVDQQGSCSIIGCQNTESLFCSCSSDCIVTNSCCSDYWRVCYQGISTNTSHADDGDTSRPEMVNTTTTTTTLFVPGQPEDAEATLPNSTEARYTGPMVRTTQETITITTYTITTAPPTGTTELATDGGTSTSPPPTNSTVTATTVLPQNQTEDCQIDMKNSTQNLSWVITVYNCSAPSTVRLDQTTTVATSTITTPIPSQPSTARTFSPSTVTAPVLPRIISSTSSSFNTETSPTRRLLFPTISYPTTTGTKLPTPTSTPRRTTAGPTRSYNPTSTPMTRLTRPIPVVPRVPPMRRNQSSTSTISSSSTRTTPRQKLSSFSTKKASTSPPVQPTRTQATTFSARGIFFQSSTRGFTTPPVPSSPVSEDIDSDEDYKQIGDEISDSTSEPSYSRWREFPRRPYPSRPTESSGVSMTVVALGCIFGVLAIVVSSLVAFYVFSRKRKPKQRSLADDSEMRFLPQSDEVEMSFGDSSESTRLK